MTPAFIWHQRRDTACRRCGNSGFKRRGDSAHRKAPPALALFWLGRGRGRVFPQEPAGPGTAGTRRRGALAEQSRDQAEQGLLAILQAANSFRRGGFPGRHT